MTKTKQKTTHVRYEQKNRSGVCVDSVGWMRVTAPSLPTRDWHFKTTNSLESRQTALSSNMLWNTFSSSNADFRYCKATILTILKACITLHINVSETCSSVKEWKEQEHQLHTDRVTNLRAEEDHPSKPRPYKQYCTTLLTLVKAEAILIGACLQGDTPFFCQCEVRGASDSAA